jgi:predicted Fe-Mo cluster-binding NifX family protein
MSKNKYVIATNGATKVSIISDLAARAPFYLLFDQSGTLLEALKNPIADTPGRAAPQAAEFLAEAGVTKLVAEKFGRKMVSELASKGIDHLELKGTVESAIRRLLEK